MLGQLTYLSARAARPRLGSSPLSNLAVCAECGMKGSAVGSRRLVLPRKEFSTKSLLQLPRAAVQSLDTEAVNGSFPPPVARSSRSALPGKALNGRKEDPFERAGLNPQLSKLLHKAFPMIIKPTPTQEALISTLAERPRTDLVLRAHTGTGKSFGLLLSLLSQPRLKIRTVQRNANEDGENVTIEKLGISAIVIVPTNELAFQYRDWARQLMPPTVVPSLDPLIQVLVRGDPSTSPEEQIAKLQEIRPHILVATPTRLQELLKSSDRPSAMGRILGIRDARTLALDEVDDMMGLPGRFPSKKAVWKSIAHESPIIKVLNYIMKIRPTCSGGEPFPSAGMEPMLPEQGATRGSRRLHPAFDLRPTEDIRRAAHQGTEALREKGRFTAPRPRLDAEMRKSLPPAQLAEPERQPIQLVCISATANSVLRHFLGAKTGWLRVGKREKGKLVGKWLDFTGMSGRFTPSQRDSEADGMEMSSLNVDDTLGPMPKELQHYCLVVDGAPAEQSSALPPLRNLTWSYKSPSREQREDLVDAEESWRPDAVEGLKEANVDEQVIRSCAFVFAIDTVSKGLAVVPSYWSIRKTQEAFQKLGVPASIVGQIDAKDVEESEGPQLHLIQASSLRGLHIPDLTHVFILGVTAAGDAVRYTHIAGRAARVQTYLPDPDNAPPLTGAEMPDFIRHPAKVITFVHGLTAEQLPHASRLLSKNELKMKAVYKRLGIKPARFAIDAAKDEEAL